MFELFKDLKTMMGELSDDFKTMKVNLARVQEETLKAEQVGKALQTKVNEFEISIAPRIEKINSLIDEITKQVE
ncbi:hypothetical protein [Lactococcus taiwanensis]|jgi:hypothetical protein|uniref:Uncharacterized protein n=1 Tax=Lactococcus taiwanensis TaxID=1151742 RepID=A0AA45KFY7_9LACT|nr:hypothetical protein [Lactococcus taiwanensis]KZK36965.1 hypothetical protein P7266_1609 [Lactococcus cremoris]QRZ10946.1 hypothetical protein JVB21_09370 [Lactococcus taiwanensis]QSE76643.1 hypothetical protein JW886_09365 [Lactococcus taiwanensis]